MQIHQVMTRGTQCVRPGDSIPAATERLHEMGLAALPVCGDNNRLVGMVTERDLVTQAETAGDQRSPACIGEVMRPSIYCFQDQDLADAERLMKDNHVHRLAVLNREMRLVGMVWLGDVTGNSDDGHPAQVTRARFSGWPMQIH